MTAPDHKAETLIIPKAAIDWLMGEGPDPSGHWFGDFPDDIAKPRGAFWWRKQFRQMIDASRPSHAPDNGGEDEITEEMRQAFYQATEVTSRGTILNINDGLRAVLALRRSTFSAGVEADGCRDRRRDGADDRWFYLGGDARLGACATEGCGGQPVWRLEVGGVGSNYCSGCAERIDAAFPHPHQIKEGSTNDQQD